jgi:hypothetical protein
MLDLNGDGVRTLSARAGVRFDIDGDGRLEQVGWVDAIDGLLVRDLDQDGVIDDGTELFGSATKLADGTRANEGFQALAALDSNRDGRVDAQDAAFSELRVWVDANSDGKTDAGELKTLKDVGVASLLVDPSKSDRMDNGNLIGLLASYETTDGRRAELADVWLRKLPVNENDAAAAGLGQALSQASAAPPAAAAGAPSAEKPPLPTPSGGTAAELGEQLGAFGQDGKPLPQGLVPRQAVDMLHEAREAERQRGLIATPPGVHKLP